MTNRRQFLSIGAAAFALAMSASGAVQADDYPSKPIQLLVPFGQGGATDQVARLMAPLLEEALGTSIVIVNQPGAGGAVGLSNLARMKPDGYTIGIGSDTTLGARPMMSETGYDASSFETIARIVEIPSGIAVRADSEYQNLRDLIQAMESKKLTYSGSGVASGPHLAAAVFLSKNHVDGTFVNSNSNQEGMVKLLSGEVDFLSGGGSNFPSMLDKDGKGDIRVLGLAAEERWPYLPNVPTYREQGFDYLRSQWFGMVAPKGTPADRIQKLSDAIKGLVNAPEFKERLTEFYFNSAYLGPQDMRARIQEEVEAAEPILGRLGLLKK